ncbi:sulfurase [Halorientalis sp. IM1011]|uniref:MOSC domain-containing protein n=1 Tax=Halorientalis sp. IM1011 TaxID=1932360 RepID=UPI00097CD5B2|nr:MOSC domain-containing protein [Halorientalis sp. IM1011]AQL41465.1 sulfurase [Halorientalis sp. IM1011]
MTGTVERIWVTEAEGEPMEAVESVRAVPGGLEGDRYCRGTGYYSGFDECEVTLIEAEAIGRIRDRHDIDLTDGRHRRNVVTRGVDVHDLLDRRFGIGDATFEGTRPRPPCAHVEQVADEEGVAKSLSGDRGGICARVVDGGEFAAGDGIEIGESTAPDPDGLAEAIKERRS